jgi:hypothetical protein
MLTLAIEDTEATAKIGSDGDDHCKSLFFANDKDI